jgi:LmeA-like phospholipid-binding
MPPPPRSRRISGKVLALIIIPLVIIGLLFGLDRVAAVYAANVIATKIQSNGFPVKPGVSVEGFPFLTQVISKHLDGVDITAPDVPAGPVTASIAAQATGINLNSGYQSGTITHVTGTGLISFSSVASIPALKNVPGLTVSRAGPHALKLTANLQVLTATAIARVKKTGQNQFSFRIISANGIPLSLLGPIRHVTVDIPKLPLGLTVRTVSVSTQGVVIGVAGSDVPFGQ